jgi:GNAT superfamily N-acetyltransferase
MFSGVAEFSRDLPIVGGAMENAGQFIFEESYKAVGAPFNALSARLWEGIYDMPDDADVPWELTMLAGRMGFGGKVGEMKRKLMANQGFTHEDGERMRAGEAGWFDFGEKKIVGNDIADMGIRALFDPLNLVFGAGIVTKGARFSTGLVKSLAKSQQATRALTRTRALPPTSAVSAITAKSSTGVTQRGLGDFLVKTARSGNKWWMRTAAATTAGEIAVNAVPDDWMQAPGLSWLNDLGEDMGQYKPLSSNQLFQITSLMFFPVRNAIGTAWSVPKSVINKNRRYGQEIHMLKKLYPDMPYQKARAAAVQRAGSEESFRAAVTQTLKASVHHKNTLMRAGDNPTAKAVKSDNPAVLGAEMQRTNLKLVKLMTKALEEGSLTSQDIIRGVENMFATRGGAVPALTKGVERQVFDTEEFWRNWEHFESAGRHLAETFPEGSPFVPGLTDTITYEGADWAIDFVKDVADSAGTISGRDLRVILDMQPGLLRAAKKAQVGLTRDAQDARIAIKGIVEELTEIRNTQGIPQAQYYMHAREWEMDANLSEVRTYKQNQHIAENGQIAMETTPEVGMAQVEIITDTHKRANTSNIPIGHTSQVKTLRAQPNVQALEVAIAEGLRRGGYQNVSAVATGIVQGSASLSALALRFNKSVDPETLRRVAALGLEAVEKHIPGVGKLNAQIVYRGTDALKNKGLTANAREVVYKVGADADFDDIATFLHRKGLTGRVSINEGGIVRVLVRDKDISRLNNAIDAATDKLGKPVADANVHVMDVHTGRKVNLSDPAGTQTVKSVATRARASSEQYNVASSYIENRLALGDGPGSGGTVVDGGTGTGRGPAGGGGAGPNGAPDPTVPTRWESGPGGGRVRGRTSKYIVADGGLSVPEYEARVHSAHGSSAFRATSDDTLFATADGHAGAVVRGNGEVRIWHSRDSAGRRLPVDPAEVGEMVAEASAHGSWTRLIDEPAGKLSTVDYMAEHGWAVVARTVGDDAVVWMVRDPDGVTGAIQVPPRDRGLGGYTSVREQVPTVKNPQSGRAQAMANASMVDPKVREMTAAQQLLEQPIIKALKEVDETINAGLTSSKNPQRWAKGKRAQRLYAQKARLEIELEMGERLPHLRDAEVEVAAQVKAKKDAAAAAAKAEANKPPWQPEEPGPRLDEVKMMEEPTPQNIHEGLTDEGIERTLQANARDGLKTSAIYEVPRAPGSDRIEYLRTNNKGEVIAKLDFTTYPMDPVAFPTVIVRADYRRRGIATELYNYALDQGYDLRGPTIRYQNKAGKAFVESLKNEPYVYHATSPEAAYNIVRSSGLRPSERPNMASTVEAALKTRPDKKPAVIFRTRRSLAGGQAISDELHQSGLVPTSRMEVSYDGGQSWASLEFLAEQASIRAVDGVDYAAKPVIEKLESAGKTDGVFAGIASTPATSSGNTSGPFVGLIREDQFGKPVVAGVAYYTPTRGLIYKFDVVDDIVGSSGMMGQWDTTEALIAEVEKRTGSPVKVRTNGPDVRTNRVGKAIRKRLAHEADPTADFDLHTEIMPQETKQASSKYSGSAYTRINNPLRKGATVEELESGKAVVKFREGQVDELLQLAEQHGKAAMDATSGANAVVKKLKNISSDGEILLSPTEIDALMWVAADDSAIPGLMNYLRKRAQDAAEGGGVTKGEIAALDHNINMARSDPNQPTVYHRGVDTRRTPESQQWREDLDNLADGETFEDPAYVSMSASRDTAKSFSHDVMFDITVPPNNPLGFIDNPTWGEQERLAGRNSRFMKTGSNASAQMEALKGKPTGEAIELTRVETELLSSGVGWKGLYDEAGRLDDIVFKDSNWDAANPGLVKSVNLDVPTAKMGPQGLREYARELDTMGPSGSVGRARDPQADAAIARALADRLEATVPAGHPSMQPGPWKSEGVWNGLDPNMVKRNGYLQSPYYFRPGVVVGGSSTEAKSLSAGKALRDNMPDSPMRTNLDKWIDDVENNVDPLYAEVPVYHYEDFGILEAAAEKAGQAELAKVFRAKQRSHALKENLTMDLRLLSEGEKRVDDIRQISRDEGGVTVSADDLTPVDSTDAGYSVSMVDGDFAVVNPDDLDAIVQAVADAKAAHPDAPHIGTWLRDDGMLVVDPVVLLKDRAQAEAFGISRGQDAIYEFATGNTINLPPARTRRAQVTRERVNPDVVRHVAESEDELASLHPYMDESLDGNYDKLAPGERQKLNLLEHENRAYRAEYNVKAAPRGATPYFREQPQAYQDIMRGRQYAEDNWRFRATDGLARAQNTLFSPVYSLALRNAQRQEYVNEFLNAGASQNDVNNFTAALQHAWENSTKVPGTQVKVFRSADALTPTKINDIASGKYRVNDFSGFSDEVLKNINGDAASLLQRADSRMYRTLAKKFPAVDGEGNLGNLIEAVYGKQEGLGAGTGYVVRRGTYFAKTAYHILRFVADPRWHLMNLFEADILAMARSGWRARAILGGEARGGVGFVQGMKGAKTAVTKDPALEKLGRNVRTDMLSVDEITQLDNMSSGWLDPRELYGYTKEMSAIERPQVTRDLLIRAIDEGNPVIDDLMDQFGGNPEQWVDELEDMLYKFDSKGIRQTILDEHAKLGNYADDIDNFDEFLDGLYVAHQKNYQDIIHTLHGNVNRSNLERLANSPLLWWPLSYQLKAGKWVVDLMTKQMVGAKTDMLGTGLVYKVLKNHEQNMERSEGYAAVFEEHPALWQTLGMMLPMTPFDMGVFMARWTRYSGSWLGAQMGLWEQDPSYPQDPTNFALRSLQLGPVFSADLFADIMAEFDE